MSERNAKQKKTKKMGGEDTEAALPMSEPHRP